MKKFLVLTVIAGLLAGLGVTIYEMSARPKAHPHLKEGTPLIAQTAARPQTPIEKPHASSAMLQTAPTPTRPVSREDQSWQLQLEIERALVSIDDAQRNNAYTKLLPELIKLDPAAAKQLVANWPVGPMREQLLRHAVHEWSAISVDGAIEWTAGMKDDDERTIAASEIVSKVAQGDPARAIGISDQFAFGRKDGTVEHMMQVWAATNLQESLSWAEGQPPGPQRDQLIAPVAAMQAETAPADAASTVLTQIGAGPVQDDAVARVVRRWSTQDPDAASAWVEGLPKGHIRDVAQAAAEQAARLRAIAAAGS